MSRTTGVMALIVFTIVCKVVYVASVACRDMNGNDVDWYYVYKLPQIIKDKDPFVKKGVAFYYLDNSQQTFQKSTTSIEDVLQPVAQTLNQIYNQPTMVAYIMYNEAPQNQNHTQSYRGHTKGVVAYGRNNGFWMIHSVPKFPPIKRYTWATNGYIYGQSILCVSFMSTEMETIAKQMMFNYPYVYNSSLPSDLLYIAPTFQKVVNGGHVKKAPWSSTVRLRSRCGQNFTHYAKFKSFNKDIYLDLVAKDLRSNLQVETWQRGEANRVPSECSCGYCVRNIVKVRFHGLEFNETKDHSKWAVSDDSTKTVCVGDINRERSQLKRSGGTLCSHLPDVWEQYNDIVAEVEPVPVPLPGR